MQKKTAVIQIPCTLETKEKITKKAHDSGRTLSGHLRYLIENDLNPDAMKWERGLNPKVAVILKGILKSLEEKDA